MKTILTLGVGFWLGRQLYIGYDTKQALAKEAAIKKRLSAFLKAHDFTSAASKKHSNAIVGN